VKYGVTELFDIGLCSFFNSFISILTCFKVPGGEIRNSVHDAVCGSHNCRRNKSLKRFFLFISSYTVLYQMVCVM
jgi:hypothetical protein